MYAAAAVARMHAYACPRHHVDGAACMAMQAASIMRCIVPAHVDATQRTDDARMRAGAKNGSRAPCKHMCDVSRCLLLRATINHKCIAIADDNVMHASAARDSFGIAR